MASDGIKHKALWRSNILVSMRPKRWNKAQSFMEIEYLGFNAAYLVIVVHLSKNQRERYFILLLIIIISHQI